ncbi:LOW QUALITY PROTEIN: hypothetical protein PHMEG_00014518 [Phytophthora megakarya]|uniref:Uncharacterized protein n=1 Tax=Phytophthora megakarya TaxID=4795 RepID=A0A225W451_9STRA|nr:LOW QUALITY PROTEIN: hypothetical protein PHMEG_00014518 [Phytophthora megakarya]
MDWVLELSRFDKDIHFSSWSANHEHAALACLMWHCFGRSSDLGQVSKEHITISADNVFYTRMLRVKTTEEQGLNLEPDRDDFLTCPLHALAVALVMQEAPYVSLLSQLSLLAAPVKTSLNTGEPLLEMLEAARSKTTLAASSLVSNSNASPSPTITALAAPVIGVLTAYLIKYLPQENACTGLFVVRVEECLDAAGITVADMLAWSSALNDVASMPIEEERINHCKSGCHHAAVINELIESNRLMAARLLLPAPHESTREEAKEQEASVQEQPVKRRMKAATNLSSMWFEWYTRMSRIWDPSDRQKKSDYRLVVAYMKLFLDDGFLLHEGAEDFKDRVLEIGLRAESTVLPFLSGHSIRSKGGSSVLREMRKLHRVGKLIDRILSYRSRLAVEKIVDPAPVGTQNILQIDTCQKS